MNWAHKKSGHKNNVSLKSAPNVEKMGAKTTLFPEKENQEKKPYLIKSVLIFHIPSTLYSSNDDCTKVLNSFPY